MSSGRAPVEIASTLMALSPSSRIRAPAPNSFSMWSTAACSAWSRAFASFSVPASLKLGSVALDSLALDSLAVGSFAPDSFGLGF